MSFPHLMRVAVRNSDCAATSDSPISVLVGRRFTSHQLAQPPQRLSGKLSGRVTMENIKEACSHHCQCSDKKAEVF